MDDDILSNLTPPQLEAVIHKDDDPYILRCPDHSSGRLQHLIHARKPVGIVKSAVPLIVKILL